MFHGSIPALVTPFRNGAIDRDAFAALVERQIVGGSSALVPVGTTGETSTLSTQEHKDVVTLCVEITKGRVPVIAGAGANATDEAIELVEHAKAVGADAALVVCPYYNNPNQEGLEAHFRAINDSVALPVLLYNVPGRTVVDLAPDTVARLAQLPNIVGIKDATGDMDRVSQHAASIPEGTQFVQLSGDDPSALGHLAMGGMGCISVTANVAPKLCAEMQAATLKGDYDTALTYQDRLMPLHEAIFIEPGLVGAKYGLSRLGLCSEEVRSPLTGLEDSTKAAIDAAMAHAGIEV